MFYPNTKIIYVNKKTLELYKANSKEDFILRMKRKFKDDKSVTDEVLLYNKKEILSLIEGETTYESEITSKTLTGDTIYLYVKTSIMTGFESTWSKVIISLIDITENKIAETKLKESEEKFRTIAEQSLMGIGILQDYKLKYANKRLANIFGYTLDEMLQIDFFEFLQLIHEEDREKIAQRVDREMDRIQDTITFYHFRANKKTGELFWVEVFSKIINYQGKRASLLTMLDITEMKVAEIRLKESEEQFRTISEQSFM